MKLPLAQLPLVGLFFVVTSLSPAGIPSKPADDQGDVDGKYKSGLAAWRRPGRVANAACANCHGPDGFELAIYNFTDATILRRAQPHLDDASAEQVVDLIHAVREKYKITHLLDPMEDRPLQPTGHVLPGKTPAERDEAFGSELETKLPLLAKGRISTLDRAKAAAEQMMSLDPWTLEIGVPFNRFSEDVFHGREHASLAHWLPDVARILPAENAEAWYAAQDDYLQSPTDGNLWKLYDRFDELTKPSARTGIADISAFKYKSLLLMQHALRRQALGEEIARSPISFGSRPEPMIPNPMWEVGDIARRFQDLSGSGIGLDAGELEKKSGGPTFRDQMQDMQVSWFWLGWLFDQGLNRTSRNAMASRGDWLAFSLANAGPYPTHNVYWITRKQLVANRIPNSWGGMPDRRRPEWDYLAIRVDNRYISDMPKGEPARQRYIAFTANCFRMNLLLMLDDWTHTKKVWYRNEASQHVKALTQFIEDYDPSSREETIALRNSLDSALAACADIR